MTARIGDANGTVTNDVNNDVNNDALSTTSTADSTATATTPAAGPVMASGSEPDVDLPPGLNTGVIPQSLAALFAADPILSHAAAGQLLPLLQSTASALESIYGSIMTAQPVQLADKKALFGGLDTVDKMGMLTPGLNAIFDGLLKTGKIPAAYASQKPMFMALATDNIRAEAWVVGQADFHGWEALGKDLIKQASATQATVGPNESAFENSDFIKELENLANAKFSQGNEITRLGAGAPFFDAVLDLVKTSTEPVYANYWAIYGDNSGKAFVDAIEERAQKGLETYIMVDAKVAHHPGHGGVEVLPKLEALGKHVHLQPWEDDAKEPTGNHMKFITNGQTSIVGGSNIGDAYTHVGSTDPKKDWSDANVSMTGPAAQDLVTLFASRWNPLATDAAQLQPAATQPLTTTKGSKVAVVSHAPGMDSHITTALLKMAEGAKDTVRIKNAYFIMTPPLEMMIRGLFERGIKIDLFTNSGTSVDEPTIAGAILKSAKQLLEIAEEMGVPELARVYLKEGATLHDKEMGIDDQAYAVKSYNWHPRSLMLEHETAFIINDKDAAAKFVQDFKSATTDPQNAILISKISDFALPAPGPQDALFEIFTNVL